MSSEPQTDPRVAKILTDLLGLALSDNEPQGEAAIGAVRRRAQRDGVTGGAVKALASRLLAEGGAGEAGFGGLPAVIGGRDHAYDDLRWTAEDQQRELEQTRHARQLAEAALTDSKKTNFSLADQIGRLNQARRIDRLVGIVAGATFGIALCVGIPAVLHRSREAAAPRGIGGASASLNGVAARTLNNALRSCFLTSGNSLGGGTSFAMHVLLDIKADGTVAGISLAQDQADDAEDDPGKKIYAALVLRTLGSASCGVLPLPASLRGRADHLDFYLPP